MNLTALTIAQTHQGLIKKDFSALELAKAYLDKIAKQDKKICSFLTVTREFALSQAKIVDGLILQNRKIPLLAGIPLAVKDNILVDGIRCTAASKILENYIAPYDATVIKKLKLLGAIILGKTNLDEFAMGSSCENSAFAKTRNPCDLARVPGGSSGGSAAAVAADLCCCALGSDTGGSIRLPASFCGVVGLKPTYGAVSRSGLIAMASSLDQIGPLAKTVEDAEIVFNAISGKDPFDSTSVELNSKIHPVKFDRVKIGIPKEYFVKGMDKEVEKIIRNAIKKYENAGAKIEEISLPHTEYGLAVYYIIMASEVSANLARYGGIKYGYSAAKAQKDTGNLLDVYLQSRGQGFGKEVRRRIMLGTFVLSAGYYDAYYLRAQKVRTLIKQDFNKAFKKVDVILTSCSPFPAFRFGEKITEPLTMYLSDIFMVAANLAGLPALSLPCGRIGKLPVGLQIIGKSFEEEKILKVGKILEKI
jgi:aspartyl-tRNA(Asn)/glutamyl-tRNA(Gln) amidotransferase subunit A